MKKFLIGLAVAGLTVAGLASGCGNYDKLKPVGADTSGPQGHAASTPRSGDSAAGIPAQPRPPIGQPQAVGTSESDSLGRTVELLVRGEDPGSYSSVVAQVREVQVQVDGQPVAVELHQHPMELTTPDSAWVVGKFQLAPNAKEVAVTMAFDDSGSFVSKTGDGTIDFQSPPIHWEAPAAYFTERNHGVVHVDLSRSVIGSHGGRLFLPNLQVHY